MAKAESKILSPDALGEIVRAGKSETLVFFAEEDYLKTVWSERIAKVVMTAGCISKNFDISNYIYIHREIGNSANQNLAQISC